MAQFKRRDLRRGKHFGRIEVTSAGIVTIVRWDEPLAGYGSEVFRLVSPNELHVEAEMRVGRSDVKYTVIYNKKRWNRFVPFLAHINSNLDWIIFHFVELRWTHLLKYMDTIDAFPFPEPPTFLYASAFLLFTMTLSRPRRLGFRQERWSRCGFAFMDKYNLPNQMSTLPE